MLYSYREYLFRHIDQLDGLTPSEVLRMARGIFPRFGRSRAFKIRPIGAIGMPRRLDSIITDGRERVAGVRVG